MIIHEISVSLADFESFDWAAVLDAAQHRTCDDYTRVFSAERDRREDPRQRDVLTILSAICSMWLSNDDDPPFKPLIVTQQGRSPDIDDFSNSQLETLGAVALKIGDPELRARLADIVWLRKRDYQLAQLAVEAYLQSAELLDTPDHPYFSLERVERALRLAASLGKQEHFEQVVRHIESSIDKHANSNTIDSPIPVLMRFLQEYERGDFSRYAELSGRLATLAESNQVWYLARAYWQLQATWSGLIGDKGGVRNASLAAAETYVQEARGAIKQRQTPSYLAASELLRHAIEALRRLNDTKERQDELHKLMLEYQEKSLEEFGRISSDSIDITDTVRGAIAQVSGKSLHEAIIALALVSRSPQVSEVEEAVKQISQQSPFTSFFASTIADYRGRSVKRRPGISDSDPERAKVALTVEMFSYALRLRDMFVSGLIEPARRQINREHHIRLSDLRPFVSDNPFVPASRELIFAQGLYAGFTGDFLVSCHLLIPQIESSLRNILNQRGIITSSLSPDGIQEDFDLNRLLYMPEVKGIFGEDILFDLRGLLVEAAGSNLRNRLAHGLVSRGEFFSPEGIYLWWLVLQICCLPILVAIGDQTANPHGDTQNEKQSEQTGGAGRGDEAQG